MPWGAILSAGDVQSLWNKLYGLISKHSSVRHLAAPYRSSHDRLMDIYADLTQELFLKLHRKGRWQFYVAAGYADNQVEHELYHIEVPNLISCLLRKRYPESYRLVRRVSSLLRTSIEFKHYERPVYFNDNGSLARSKGTCRKHALKVYGLSSWPLWKAVRHTSEFPELIKDVEVRLRDTRRTGRGSASQLIISNNELLKLMVDIFNAIDSPTDVRTFRAMVLSKIAVEDSRFISLDGDVAPGGAMDVEPVTREFADHRPTPEQVLLEKEMLVQAEVVRGKTQTAAVFEIGARGLALLL
jgi:hypothetical protein